jgi:hypothetical protein
MYNRRCATPCVRSPFPQRLRLQFLLRLHILQEDVKNIMLFRLVNVPVYLTAGLSSFILYSRRS